VNATTEDAAGPGGLALGVRSLTIERAWLGSSVVRALPALGLAVLVTANGWAGLQPGVAFWDTGEFQVIAPVLGTGHAPGFPTYVLVGFIANLLLTPIGEPAYRMNALSLLAIAAAAAFLMVTARRLGVPALVAAVAGFAMATAGVVWFQATRAEPHTMHLAFVGLLLLLLVEWGRRRRLELGDEPDGFATGDAIGAGGPGAGARRTADRWLVVAAVVFGLSAGNHGLTFLLAPPIVLYVLAVDPGTFLRPRLVLACAVASVGTLAAVYLELPIRAGVLPAPVVYGRPDTWDGFWYVVLATQFHGLLGDPLADLPGKLRDLVDVTVAQFGVLAVLIPVGFAATIRIAPRFAVLSGSAMAITLFWNSFFQDGYIDRYYLGPVFWAWLWLAILGAFVVERALDLLDAGPSVDRWSAARRSAVRPLVAAVVAVGLLLPGFADWSVKAAAADRRGDTAAARWLDEVLPAMAPDAIVVSWWSTSTPLWYAQHVEGRRTDVFVVDDRTMLDLELGRAPDVLDACLGVRPVYALRANQGDLQELLGQFDMTLVASGGSLGLYEVHARTVGQASGPGRCPPPSS